MAITNMIRIHPDAANSILPLPLPVVEYLAYPNQVVTDPGTTTIETDDDVVLNKHTGSTVRNDIQIEISSELGNPLFESLSGAVSSVDQNGYVTCVSDGTARTKVILPGRTAIIKGDVSIVTPTTSYTLNHWADGSFGGYANTIADPMIDGITPGLGSQAVYSSGTTRNTNLFCASYVESLTAITHSVNGGIHLGLTAITPQHAVGNAHATFPVDVEALWITSANTVVPGTLVASYRVPGRDIVVYVLDSPLPESIVPMKLLPADIGDYLRNPEYRVPMLFHDRDNEINCADLTGLTEDVATMRKPEGGRAAFFEMPIPGTSGEPGMGFLSDDELALGFTFHYPAMGPSYHALDWTAIIAAADTAAGIATGYTPAVADLSTFTDFSV